MLINLWEKIHGYDHWTSTEATIESSQMEDHVYTYRGQTSHEYDSRDRLAWIDSEGNRHTGDCEIPDDSPLYQLIEQEKVAIRYNPNDPDQYYFPELVKARLHHKVFQAGFAVLFAAVVVGLELLFSRVFK